MIALSTLRRGFIVVYIFLCVPFRNHSLNTCEAAVKQSLSLLHEMILQLWLHLDKALLKVPFNISKGSGNGNTSLYALAWLSLPNIFWCLTATDVASEIVIIPVILEKWDSAIFPKILEWKKGVWRRYLSKWAWLNWTEASVFAPVENIAFEAIRIITVLLFPILRFWSIFEHNWNF